MSLEPKCFIPTAVTCAQTKITVESTNADCYKPVDTRRENVKPESPPLKMHHRAFILASVANFEWAGLTQDAAIVQKVESSSINRVWFTQRGFKIARSGSNRKSATPSATRRHSITPIASIVKSVPTRRKPSVTVVNMFGPNKTEPFALAEIIISRAIELETQNRSPNSDEYLVHPLQCWFASEVIPGLSDLDAFGNGRLPAARIIPASFGTERSADKVEVLVKGCSASDLNELRWLLGTVVNVEHAIAFTRLVERRAQPGIHILLTQPLRPHPFKLASPWRTAWKWLCKPSLASAAKRAYLTAIATSWAPLPATVEGTWIYTLAAEAHPRATASTPYNFRDESISADAFVDCTESGVFNSGKQDEDLALDQRKRGFTSFLWDLVAFWRGIAAVLEDLLRHWVPPNEDLSVLAAAALRSALSGRHVGAMQTGRIPLTTCVISSWNFIRHFRGSVIGEVEPTDCFLVIPQKLTTTEFQLNDAAVKKDKILFHGYKLNPTENKNVITFGISTAGLHNSKALRVIGYAEGYVGPGVVRAANPNAHWIFEVDEGFALCTRSNGVLFEALSGSGINAKYDEKYARYFCGDPPVNAVADYPRCVFYSSSCPKKQRIMFSIQNSDDIRNLGVYSVLEKLQHNGGVLSIRCLRCVTFLHRNMDQEPLLATMLSTRKMTAPYDHHCQGRIRSIVLSPGVYKVKDIVSLKDKFTGYERSRASFLQLLCSPEDEIEIYFDDEDNEEPNETDVHCLQLESGTEVFTLQLSDNDDTQTSGAGTEESQSEDGTQAILVCN